MRDFDRELERQLAEAARRQARSPAREPRRGRRLLLTIPAAAAAAVAVALLVAGGEHNSALAFPVLARPAVDASGIEIATQLRHDGAELRAARVVDTAYGRGYVFPRAGGGLCVAIPDPTGGYVQGCAAEAEARRRGVLLSFIPPAPGETGGADHAAEFVAVLPATATTPLLRDAGGSRDLAVDDGVVATLVHADADITYEVDGQARKAHVPAHAPASGARGAKCEGGEGHFKRLGPGSKDCR